MVRFLALAASLIAGLTSGCQTTGEPELTKEQRFWAWFETNESSLYDFEADREAIFNRLHAEMLKVYPSASFEIGPVLDDGRREFILSAGGNTDGFAAVEALHAAAPPLLRWVFVKFIPRRSTDPLTKVEADGSVLQTSDLRYILRPAGQQVDVSVFVEGARRYDADQLEYLVWTSLKTLLGEEDLGIRLRHYSILDEESAGYDKSRSIADLATDFDAYFAEQRKGYN